MNTNRLKQWLDKGADINALDEKGNSRLHRAVINDEPQEVALLLESGASPTLLNKDMLSAIDFAKYLNRSECRKLLKIPETKKFLLKEGAEMRTLSKEELESTFGFRHIDYIEFPYVETLEYLRYLCHGFVDEKIRIPAVQWGERFGDQIEAGYMVPSYLEKIDDTIGYGLFSLKKIPADSYIGEYGGVIIEPPPGCNPAYQMKYALDNINGKAFVLEARDDGNIIRFANHSDDFNVRPIISHYRDIIHIILISVREIKAGEQLCYNYGKGYWSGTLPKLQLPS